MTTLSLCVVLLVALFLVAQGLLALLRPQWLRRFLAEFAGSARAHYLELLLRILVGSAFLHSAPMVRHPPVFETIGLVLIATTLLLLCVPWRVHRRFAQWAVPQATRHLGPYALACLAAGAYLIQALLDLFWHVEH